jgi:hypothetical protein
VLSILVEHEIDLLVSAVDEPVCRVLLNRAAAQRRIAIMNTANIGWKAYNSFHLPAGVTYEEMTFQYSHGKEITPELVPLLQLQQKFFIATVGGFRPEFAEAYLTGKADYISYSAPPAFFAASQAVAVLARWCAGRIPLREEPYTFCFDLAAGCSWDPRRHGQICGQAVAATLSRGFEAGVRTWKEQMAGLDQ